MKDKPSEWVAISDLMAGVMAVVMLLLVVSVLKSTFSEMKHQQELLSERSIKQEEKEKLSKMLENLEKVFIKSDADSLVKFDFDAAKITLRDSIFSRGSACITPKAKKAFKSIEDNINEFLTSFSNGQIYVEGHTDNIPVSHPVINYSKYCTVYDDNFTLSAARAREARNLLVGALSDADAKRVIVAGYGDSQPLDPENPSAAKNRRVEVNFIMDKVVKDQAI